MGYEDTPRLRQKELAARYAGTWGEECPQCDAAEELAFMQSGEGMDRQGRRWLEYVCYFCHLHWRATFGLTPDEEGDEAIYFSDIVAFRLLDYDGLHAMPKQPACAQDREDDDG